MSTSWNVDGIDEKLNRAKENIENLSVEIDRFLAQGGNRILPNDKSDSTGRAIKTHISRKIPPRFSVLAGECFYNLRSALDQLAWQLVLANKGTPGQLTGFPIYTLDPTDKRSMARYNGYVEGMSDTAKARILALQPFQAGNGEGQSSGRLA